MCILAGNKTAGQIIDIFHRQEVWEFRPQRGFLLQNAKIIADLAPDNSTSSQPPVHQTTQPPHTGGQTVYREIQRDTETDRHIGRQLARLSKNDVILQRRN